MIAGGGAIVAPAPGLPTSQPLPALDWKFSQVFGERAAGEEVQEGARYHICSLSLIGADLIFVFSA
jgi:hypothetical protein